MKIKPENILVQNVLRFNGILMWMHLQVTCHIKNSDCGCTETSTGSPLAMNFLSILSPPSTTTIKHYATLPLPPKS
jgi:hypothetical protein